MCQDRCQVLTEGHCRVVELNVVSTLVHSTPSVCGSARNVWRPSTSVSFFRPDDSSDFMLYRTGQLDTRGYRGANDWLALKDALPNQVTHDYWYVYRRYDIPFQSRTKSEFLCDVLLELLFIDAKKHQRLEYAFSSRRYKRYKQYGTRRRQESVRHW